MATTDEVRLVVPAMPEYLRLARVTAAGLASRLGFSFDEVEDLRLAIDELCYGLTGSSGRPGTVQISYLVSEDRLVVEGDGDFDGPAAADWHGAGDDGPVASASASASASGGLSELSRVILAALVDAYEISGPPLRPHFRLVKGRGQTVEPGSAQAHP